MSAPNVRNVLRMPGRLVWNPTNLANAYPHGGTELGVARDMEFRFGLKTEKLIAEEFKRPVAVIVTGEEAVMAGVLRSYDNALVTQLFPNTATGSSSGDIIIAGLANSGNRAGYDMAAQSGKLLFSPQAIDAHPMVLLYNAVPSPQEAAALSFKVSAEFGLGFFFIVTPDSRGWDYRIGKRDDLASLL